METTQRKEPAQVSSTPRNLEQENTDLWRANSCLHRRIEFLEFVLKQRLQQTRNKYSDLKPYFETLQREALKIFLDLPAGTGLTYEEIYQEFHEKYPKVNTVFLYRRIRELVEDKKLWTSPDVESGKLRFYLILEKSEGEKST
jgi:hypothetical protein